MTQTRDLPNVTAISEARPLARLPHRCTICGRPIAIGSRYGRYVYRDDDALDRKTAIRVAKFHIICDKSDTETFYDERI